MSNLTRIVVLLLVPVCLVACGRTPPAPAATKIAAPAAPPPLLSRELLFGNPERARGQISPDGRWLGYIAPRDGVLNVYIAPADAPDAAKPVTNDRVRGIRDFRFPYTGQHVMYAQDVGGDENYQTFVIDLTTNEEKALSPKGSRSGPPIMSPQHPDEVVLSINDRDPRYFDLVRVNLKTGAQSRLIENKEFSDIFIDSDFNLRYAGKQTPDGGQQLFVRDGKDWKPWSTVPQEDALTTNLVGMTTDGKTLYMLDSRGRDTAALFAVDTATGKSTLVYEDARADVGGALTHPVTGVVQAVAVDYLRNRWTAIDPSIAADLKKLEAIGDGDVGVVSRTLADDRWVVVYSSSLAPVSYYLYDRKSGDVRPWFDTRPALKGATTASMRTAEIKSRDGLTLPTYYTLPPGSDPDGDGKPNAPVPLVLWVHGGPWGRDGYGFNPVHQWLANRGYAVLSMNYRGSTGFGKKFTNAGDLEWGRKMHDDVLDTVAWAVDQGIAARDRVAITGASYGGYATLAGVTMTPKEFACGVDLFGPSNLNTLLAAIPQYWGPIKKLFTTRMGDDATDAGRALLKERSPLTYAGQIERPLLIGQGANDARVKQAESDQIVAAMQQNKIPVTYLVYGDEGHGFARPENNLSFWAATDEFLGKCLGGRVEPVGNDLHNSSIKVVTGGELLPGLDAAAKATGGAAAN